jgi:NitT/TauT family transport system permease protein
MNRIKSSLPALGVIVALLVAWWGAIVATQSLIFPTPWQVVTGAVELLADGTLWRHIGASLLRVGTGFSLAVCIAVPLGLWMGWVRGAYNTLNPIFQMLRPISPIAWIPVAILWFGVSDLAPIFLIFLASVFPITTATIAAVRNIQLVYLRAARNFGLKGTALFQKVVLPAALPQIITGVRLALGIAWLVVVAAEMIAVNSGLGYLIIDARNAGKRYDLVVAGMVMIGLIGLVLDILVRRLERLEEVRWGFGG